VLNLQRSAVTVRTASDASSGCGKPQQADMCCQRCTNWACPG
jgi:hypothetical protein